MPGGTASNIVAYIAKGDMPLSVMMTTASTLAAVFTTPLLTSLLVGTLVPVDATAMFLSTLQLVLAPVLAGAALNQFAPKVRVCLFSCVCVGGVQRQTQTHNKETNQTKQQQKNTTQPNQKTTT